MFSLTEVRIILEISQSELAEVLGVTQSYIAHIESGKRPLSDKLRERLFDKLEITADKLEAINKALEAQEEVRRLFAG